MHAIVKVVGVTPEAIAKLHTVLKQTNMQTQSEHCQPNWGPDTTHIAMSPTKVPYAKLMDSKLHPDSGTYTVTIRLNLVIRSYIQGEDTSVDQEETTLVFPPLSAFSEVFKSIDHRLLPETETTDKKTTPADVIDDLAEKLSLSILGEKSEFDICDSNTGEVILPCRRKITRTLIRRLAERINNLDFNGGGSSDRVIFVLRQVQLEFLSTVNK